MDYLNYIEHSILKPNDTFSKIEDSLKSGIKFKYIVVQPYFVQKTYDLVKELNLDTKVVTVVGFPLGYNLKKSKVEETKLAISNGATEIDVVINNLMVATGDYKSVKEELLEIRKVCGGNILKVILETSLQTRETIAKLTEILCECNVDFVKTSTGFIGDGAKLDDIKFLKENFGDRIKIKASGGIKTREQVDEFIKAGALRIGTSSGISIIKKGE